MEERVKYCERCGKEIAREFECDWWAFLRIKYCPLCRGIVRREQWAANSRAYRKRKRGSKELAELEERDRNQKACIEALQEENAALRQLLVETNERVDALFAHRTRKGGS